MELRLATPGDLPAISDLRSAVGWQTHPWAVVEAMRAPHARCFCLTDAGSIVALGSGISYGRLGVVGNMIVAESHRRRGLASQLLGEVLHFLEGRGVERVELFATAQGRPLYEGFGFAALVPGTMVEIARAAARTAAGARRSEVRVAAPVDVSALAAYDAPRFGGDRRPILAAAVADPDRPVLLAERDGGIVGYGMLRAAVARLGPWLADDTDAAADLLADAFARAPEAMTLTANVPGENEAGRAWLANAGARLTWSDGRMARGPDLPRRLEAIYGNAVGALG
jgi:predicted N-acetyltransferase YhbS